MSRNLLVLKLALARAMRPEPCFVFAGNKLEAILCPSSIFSGLFFRNYSDTWVIIASSTWHCLQSDFQDFLGSLGALALRKLK